MRNVILIGFMGAGKTTLGKKLARLLKYNFLDSDQLIEQRTGLSIGEIFAIHGEQHFRDLERELLHELHQNSEPFVLSTGGGLPCNPTNILSLKELGVNFYLQRTPKELAHRLKNAKSERPLIKGMEEVELVEYIESKLSEREEFYRKADFVLDREQQDPKIIRDLMKMLHPDLFQRS